MSRSRHRSDATHLHPDSPGVTSNPAARVFRNDMEILAPLRVPYAATTYRLTEHFPLLD